MTKEIKGGAQKPASEVQTPSAPARQQTVTPETEPPPETEAPRPDLYLGQAATQSTAAPVHATLQVDAKTRDAQLKLLSSISARTESVHQGNAMGAGAAAQRRLGIDALLTEATFSEPFANRADLASFGISGQRGAVPIGDPQAFAPRQHGSADAIAAKLWGGALYQGEGFYQISFAPAQGEDKH